MSNRTHDRDERHNEILAAAAAVSERDGFERMRLRDVAEEAGVSVGLIQHHFRTREELGSAAFEFVCDNRASGFGEAAAGITSAWERLEALLTYALEVDRLRGARMWLDLCSVASRAPELRPQAEEVQAAWRGPLLDVLEQGVESDEFEPALSPVELADLFMILIDGAELQAAITVDDRPGDVLEMALRVARSLVRPTTTQDDPSSEAASAVKTSRRTRT